MASRQGRARLNSGPRHRARGHPQREFDHVHRLGAVTTGAAAAISIGLWTFRVALAARGRKGPSATIAGIGAVLFVVIFTGLVANLCDPMGIFGYALGVAGGTLLGLASDERLSSGQSEVRLSLLGDGSSVIERLLQAGRPVTWSSGVGPNGPTTSVFLVIDDRRRDELFGLSDRFDPSPIVTVERSGRCTPWPFLRGSSRSSRAADPVLRGGRSDELLVYRCTDPTGDQ